MNAEREYFVFFRQSIESLNDAWRILQELRGVKGSPVLLGAAFKFALIAYCKPYKVSHGNLKDAKGRSVKHRLPEDHIPPEHLPLHRRILDARDQLLAHSDLTVLDARVYVKDAPSGRIAGYVKNNVHGLEEMQHVASVIDLIERTLDSMYIQEERLKNCLATDLDLKR